MFIDLAVSQGFGITLHTFISDEVKKHGNGNWNVGPDVGCHVQHECNKDSDFEVKRVTVPHPQHITHSALGYSACEMMMKTWDQHFSTEDDQVVPQGASLQPCRICLSTGLNRSLQYTL